MLRCSLRFCVRSLTISSSASQTGALVAIRTPLRARNHCALRLLRSTASYSPGFRSHNQHEIPKTRRVLRLLARNSHWILVEKCATGVAKLLEFGNKKSTSQTSMKTPTCTAIAGRPPPSGRLSAATAWPTSRITPSALVRRDTTPHKLRPRNN